MLNPVFELIKWTIRAIWFLRIAVEYSGLVEAGMDTMGVFMALYEWIYSFHY